MGMAVSQPLRRGDVCLIQLDPTRGSEIRKTRPCLVISPDELNQHLHTLIVAPMTTAGHAYPWRVVCRFQSRMRRFSASSGPKPRSRKTFCDLRVFIVCFSLP